MGVGGQHHAPAALPPGKTRYPLYTRLGGLQSRSGQMLIDVKSLEYSHNVDIVA
jgi:hypothetical protein